ncbi:MAG TPA: hypothetical protein VH352_28245 [Pseudonocardiaceae bacterium]|nr:hypothetical protein [Pseudonocardiaceae bacterium]
MHKLKDTDVDESAAMAVAKFALVVVFVLPYLKTSRWNEATA